MPAPPVRLDARLRPHCTVRAHVVTWDLCVFAVHPRDGGVPVFVLRARDEVPGFLAAVDEGRWDDELESLLARPPRTVLRRRPRRLRRQARPCVGIEHEYTVEGPHGRVDFRTVIHTLGIDGVRADPTDPNAYRCPWGGVITADGAEAEVAIAPVPLAPGFAAEASARACEARAALERVLPSGHRITGFSTHISVSTPRRRERMWARRYAQTFAPGLMLLMDRDTSPGLLVRPRPGRLELCGEHVADDALRAAIAYAVGSVLALRRLDVRARRGLGVAVTLDPAVERFGWYVDRSAFGVDLYAGGRDASLRRAGRRVRAQQQLEDTWARARDALAGLASEDDLTPCDLAVSGTLALPCEAGAA